MRRAEREITDAAEIERILNEAKVCRLALFDGDYPYVIPMCFGFDIDGGELEIYFHCAAKGKKVDLIKANNHAAFETDSLTEIIRSDVPCGFSAAYESVTGTGTVEIVSGVDKLAGLNAIMRKYDGTSTEYKYSEQMLNNVAILKLTAEEFCCKAHRR